MGYKVVVVGATGSVGREMLNILAERQFPLDDIAAVASSRSVGDKVEFGETGREIKVQNLEHFDFTGWDIALFAAGSGPAKIYAPKAASQGCVVIDNSSLFRMDHDVPLIVPEVNPGAIDGYKKRMIIANPNCSTAQMVVALKPLHDAAIIKRVVVSTYQSVSGAGKDGMDELFTQSRAIFVGDEPVNEKFTKRIAFNVIPHIDSFLGPDSGMDGYTKEEWKMTVETRKILDPDIEVIHSQLPVTSYHNRKPRVMFMHGEPLSSVGNGISMRAIVDLAPLVDAFIAMRQEEWAIWSSLWSSAPPAPKTPVRCCPGTAVCLTAWMRSYPLCLWP
jgi:aspartate-semialdehyde dehydrogenase